ncbi:MAG: hypothetical protein GY928_05980 [Colwellia sp.]|nr:hypothetical protein [Colwellia sp.]
MNITFPQMKSTVAIETAQDGFRIVHDQSDNRYFRLGENEADLLESLNGEIEVKQLKKQNSQRFTSEQVSHILTWFKEHQLLVGSEACVDSSSNKSWYQKALGFIIRPGEWRHHLIDPDNFLNKHKNIIDNFFSKSAFIAYLLIFISPALLYLIVPNQVKSVFNTTAITPSTFEWLIVYLMMVITIVLHELAHAATCKYFGGKVNKIGLMFMYFHPIIYCDVSDSWRFKNTNHKIIVAAAGIFLQFVLAAALLSLFMLTGWVILYYYLITTIVIALFNFIPFIKLDGYWMLVHASNQPNLKQKSIEALDEIVQTALVPSLRKKSKNKHLESKVIAFGVAHLTLMPLFLISGLYGIHRMISNFNETLAIAIICIFVIPLLYKTITSGFNYIKKLAEIKKMENII